MYTLSLSSLIPQRGEPSTEPTKKASHPTKVTAATPRDTKGLSFVPSSFANYNADWISMRIEPIRNIQEKYHIPSMIDIMQGKSMQELRKKREEATRPMPKLRFSAKKSPPFESIFTYLIYDNNHQMPSMGFTIAFMMSPLRSEANSYSITPVFQPLDRYSCSIAALSQVELMKDEASPSEIVAVLPTTILAAGMPLDTSSLTDVFAAHPDEVLKRVRAVLYVEVACRQYCTLQKSMREPTSELMAIQPPFLNMGCPTKYPALTVCTMW